MATLNELAANVYTLTNRPDLVSETMLSLRKAIRKFHAAETFKRDLKSVLLDMTVQVPVLPNEYRWALDLSLFPGVRRFKAVNYPLQYVLPQQPPFSYGVSRDFHEIAPDNLFDGYGYERLNYYYIVGLTLNLKASWYIDKLLFTYYAWPTIPTDLDVPLTSWIATEYPDAIEEEAAGAVFKMIGKDEEFNRFQALFAENLQILKGVDVGEIA